MKIEFFFDLACPFCYVATSYLQRHIKDFPSVEIVWRPTEAHPEPEPQQIIDENYKGWWKVKFQPHHTAPFEVKTTISPTPRSARAFYGFYSIQDRGGDIYKYIYNVYDAAFQCQKDFSDIEVLKSCAKDSGVDLRAFEDDISSGKYTETMKAANEYAYITNKVEYIPTFVTNGNRLDSVARVGVKEAQVVELLALIVK